MFCFFDLLYILSFVLVFAFFCLKWIDGDLMYWPSALCPNAYSISYFHAFRNALHIIKITLVLHGRHRSPLYASKSWLHNTWLSRVYWVQQIAPWYSSNVSIRCRKGRCTVLLVYAQISISRALQLFFWNKVRSKALLLGIKSGCSFYYGVAPCFSSLQTARLSWVSLCPNKPPDSDNSIMYLPNISCSRYLSLLCKFSSWPSISAYHVLLYYARACDQRS